MASTQAIQVMASTLPAGYTDLASVVQKGPQDSVSIIGYVSDYLAPSMTRGTDFQVKFALKDNSLLPNGLEIKYFRRYANELPNIGNIGDVVLLRHFRLHHHNGMLSGLSTLKTQHIVFAEAAIVSPDFRTSFQVHGTFIPHTKSPGADQPTIHEQQWVITLHHHFKAHCRPPPLKSTHPTLVQPSHQLPMHPPAPINKRDDESSRDYHIRFDQTKSQHGATSLLSTSAPKGPAHLKLCRLCDLTIDANSKGTFCDLVGEVVKLYSNDQGYLDLYLTDYTANEILPNYERGQSDTTMGKTWTGPSGKMTLHIELYPPHGPWALSNVKPGNYLYLRNVRVKYNNRGVVIGNMWPDRNFDKLNVSILGMNTYNATQLLASKKAYIDQQESVALPEVENSHNRKQYNKSREEQHKGEDQHKFSKKVRKRKRKQEGMDKSRGVHEGGEASDMDLENDTDPSTKRAKHNGKAEMATRYVCNTYVRCNHPHILLSSFEEIVNNPHRWFTSLNGIRFEMAFVNAKHRARLRVVDFYPHDLRGFSQAIPSKIASNRIQWEWNFWLVLRGGNVNEQDETCINCSVNGVDAEALIGRDIKPEDLSRANAKHVLGQLEERLFFLWGDLKERKDNFLQAHPHIKPDEEFSALKYNIGSNNLPFEACIAEYGFQVPQSDRSDSTSYDDIWRRMYKLCDTVIEA